MNIYFDIETVPAQSPAAIELLKKDIETEISAIKSPGNYKDEAKIAEYIKIKTDEITAAADEKYRKTSFDGGMGQICAISFAVDDMHPYNIYQEDWTKESEIIHEFYGYLDDYYNPSTDPRPVFIGHNVVGFDLRFLFQRSVMLGIKPPLFVPFQAKPWDQSVFDTMVAWAGVGNRVSMDKLCKIFGIESKGELDGSKVWDYVQAGKIEEVAEYCGKDVERTRAIYKRLTFQDAK